MNRFREQFNKEAEKIKMTPEERGLVRERILSFMEVHTLPQTETEVVTPRASFASYFHYWKQAGVAFVVMLMLTPVLAEDALPGDMLYPLKVRINEEVRGYLAFSPHEKIAWETTRIERRLAEARLLSLSGELSPEEEADVVAALTSHSAEAQASIDILKETDRDAASIAQIAFASALEVQADAFQSERVSAAERGEIPQHLQLSAAVAAQSSLAKEAAEEAETPSVEKLFARIEEESTVVEELLVSVEEGATEEEAEKINNRLASITRKVSNAQLLADGATTSVSFTHNNETKETSDPAEVLRAALADVRKLVSFMTNIDVRESISIDAVVPEEVVVDENEDAATTTDEAATSTDVVEDVATSTLDESTSTLETVVE
jgi:hypothetical protein